MKRMITLTLALLMLAVLLTGCNATKEFTCENLTMTVPSYLEDASDEPEFSAFTFTLDSTKMAIFGTKEALKDSVSTLQEYADLVADANNYADNAFTSKGSYYSYEYTADVDGEAYDYMLGLYDGGDAYWMIQIGAPADKFDRDQSIEILDSVKFS